MIYNMIFTAGMKEGESGDGLSFQAAVNNARDVLYQEYCMVISSRPEPATVTLTITPAILKEAWLALVIVGNEIDDLRKASRLA